MELDFRLFKFEEYEVENKKLYIIKEALHLSNATAMLIANWFNQNHNADNENKLEGGDELIRITSDDLRELIKNLEVVLGEKDIYRKELKALFYFPCMHTVPSWENSVEMFSDDYFAKLKTIHEKLKSIIKMDEYDFEEFAYNITW